MFDFIEPLRNNITGFHLDTGYIELCWEDITDQYDFMAGSVFDHGILLHYAY